MISPGKETTMNTRAINEQGFVLISAMLFLIILTTIGILATTTTTVELQISANDRITREDFYNQEMGLAVAKINHPDWLTGAFARDSATAAYFPEPGTLATDANNNGIDDRSEITNNAGEIVATYKARKIVLPAANISTWEDLDNFGSAANHPANQIPALSHKDKPPINSGYDTRTFEIRRYAITTYSPQNDRNVILQEGLYRAFPK
jgi:hypothetical protein